MVFRILSIKWNFIFCLCILGRVIHPNLGALKECLEDKVEHIEQKVENGMLNEWNTKFTDVY